MYTRTTDYGPVFRDFDCFTLNPLLSLTHLTRCLEVPGKIGGVSRLSRMIVTFPAAGCLLIKSNRGGSENGYSGFEWLQKAVHASEADSKS